MALFFSFVFTWLFYTYNRSCSITPYSPSCFGFVCLCLRLFSAFQCMHVVFIFLLLLLLCFRCVACATESTLCQSRSVYVLSVCISHIRTHLKLIQCLCSDNSWWMECILLYVHKTLIHTHTQMQVRIRTLHNNKSSSSSSSTAMMTMLACIVLYASHSVGNEQIFFLYSMPFGAMSLQICACGKCVRVFIHWYCCYSAENASSESTCTKREPIQRRQQSWSPLLPSLSPSPLLLLLLLLLLCLLFLTGASKRYNRIHFVGK